ncbi:MAG: neutral zinc metallopeptidase [Vicinamibacterales bacterium]
MRLEHERQSTNIEDRRGRRMGGRVGIGGGGIGMIIIILIVSWLTGTNPLSLLQMTDALPGGAPAESVPTGTGGDDPQSVFISKVVGDLEDTWTQIFARAGEQYQPPVLVLFDGQVQSACGFASAATGPFYCPADSKVYLDLSFFRELDQQFGAPGDFAQAYVVAHEVGHHVQNLLGVNAQVTRLQQQSSQAQANALSVRLELQADCFAGLWGHFAERQNLLEPGDVDEGLRAAAAIGDDRIQRRTQGQVVPESFTHGSSEQRAEWLRRGLASGRIEDCDTFGATR